MSVTSSLDKPGQGHHSSQREQNEIGAKLSSGLGRAGTCSCVEETGGGRRGRRLLGRRPHWSGAAAPPPGPTQPWTRTPRWSAVVLRTNKLSISNTRALISVDTGRTSFRQNPKREQGRPPSPVSGGISRSCERTQECRTQDVLEHEFDKLPLNECVHEQAWKMSG